MTRNKNKTPVVFGEMRNINQFHGIYFIYHFCPLVNFSTLYIFDFTNFFSPSSGDIRFIDRRILEISFELEYLPETRISGFGSDLFFIYFLASMYSYFILYRVS